MQPPGGSSDGAGSGSGTLSVVSDTGPDISTVVGLEDIQKAFVQLQKQEDDLNKELDAWVSRRPQLEASLKGLDNLAWRRGSAGPGGSPAASADAIAKLVCKTASLADGVSEKVKQLDLAKSRVSNTQQRVHDLIDLRLCSEGVKTALNNEDYEQAAAHLHRFLAMDPNTLRDVNGGRGGSNVNASVDTLRVAEARVKAVIAERFEEAVAAGDLSSTERFFKLFPLLNMHQEGLEKFTNQHLCVKLVEASQENLRNAVSTPQTDPRHDVIFADCLTLLFEGLARQVDIHQPLIETYYGPGRIINVVTMLQKQCDELADKILAEFRAKRRLKEKCKAVRDAAYAPKMTTSSSAMLLMAAASSPSVPGLTSSASANTLSATSGSSGGGSGSEEGGSVVDAKVLDHILSEISLLLSRADTYFKFIKKRVSHDLEAASGDTEQNKGTFQAFEDSLARSKLSLSLQELLSEYLLLEDYYMSQNVKKAVSSYVQTEKTSGDKDKSVQDLQEGGNSSALMLDDIFFIVKKCVQRAVTCQSVDGVCAVVNNANSVLETDLCTLLQAQLRMGFPSGYLDMTMTVLQTSFQQGYKMAAAQASGDTDKQKASFLVTLNSTCHAMDYVVRLGDSLTSNLRSLVAKKSQKDKDKVDSCLSGLPAVAQKLKTILDQGMTQLRGSAVKPSIKPWMEAFKTSHDIGDEEFADAEANDPFVQNLILNLDQTFFSRGIFRQSLTEKNYEAFVIAVTTEVTVQLEKVLLKTKFSRLGGLLFDRELRQLMSFLTSVTTWSIRDKFSRLHQMASVLNLESVEEAAEVCGSASGKDATSGKLTPNEVKQILELRSDFKPEEIKRLRL